LEGSFLCLSLGLGHGAFYVRDLPCFEFPDLGESFWDG